MPKAYANRLCFLSDRRFGPFHRLRDLCHGRSRFRVGFEFAQILLGPRFADRGFPSRHMLLFPAGWSTRLNYLYSVRARPTTSGRKIRPDPNAESDGIGAIGFGVEAGRFMRRASVDVTLNSAFYASACSRPCSWASATGSKTMRREGVCPDRNFAKALRREKPAQRLHSRPER